MRAMPEQQVVASSPDAAVVARLLQGDETTFMTLVDQHQPAMLRLAQMYVSSRAVAEEAVQEAWIGILKGLPSFEARSSLRTWMYKIVTNVAKTRGVREGRSLPFSSLSRDDDADPIDPSWFQGPDDAFPGGWRTFPDDWRGSRRIGCSAAKHWTTSLGRWTRCPRCRPRSYDFVTCWVGPRTRCVTP